MENEKIEEEILVVNIDWTRTTMSRDQLNTYLKKYPNTEHFIISSSFD